MTVPAGETCYVAIMFGGMEMTVNGGEPVMINGSRFMPEIHTIINDGEEDADYVLNVVVPSGTVDNPEVLTELGWVDVSLAEGDDDGYYYTYTAEGTGTATFYFGSVTEGVEADIVVTNMNTYAQKTLLADGVDNYGLELTVDVAEGDVLSIQVLVVPDANWQIAAADITMVGSFAYALGTEQNPITVEVEWNEAFTEATATVTAPVGTTYYAVYGSGMLLSINGAEPFVLTSANPRMPAVFSITNEGEAEAEYTLVMTYAAGTRENPEVLYGLGGGYAVLEAGDNDGHYYTFTVENDGTLEFTIVSVTEGVEADISVYNENTYAQKSITADGVDGVATIDVTAGDVLTIQVVALPDASWVIPAAEVEWTINYPVGTELNPFFPEFVMNDEWTEGEVTVTVPANTTYYCGSYNTGMILTINGGEEILLESAGFRMPAYFTLVNDTDEAADFVLHIAYPLGARENPEVLYGLGGGYTTLEAGDQDGYFYSFTVENDGVLEFSIASVTEGVEADVCVMNMNTYAMMSIAADGVDGVASIAASAGDELSIQVVALPDANWQYPAADIEWLINYPVGTELNPYFPEFVMNDEWTEGDAVVTVPANTTYYCGSYNTGMMLSINGSEGILLESAGFRMPAYFTLVNDTNEAADFVLHISYPVGARENPEVLYWLGGGYTELEADDNDGYYYTYTAEADGVLEFSVVSATEGATADVSVFNNATYAQRSVMYDGVDGVASIEVSAGDVLSVQVVVLPDDNWEIPAADVEWTLNYTAGHELNPIYPEFAWNEDNTADAVVTVPAGETYHFAAYAGGMLLYVNGEFYTELVGGMGRVPAFFTITNGTEADAEYALHLEYPVGNSMNPAELLVYVEGESWDELEGQNIATVEEGDWYGYNYTWTAPADGQLTITMSNGKAGWFYVINNMTTYAYGDNHFSCNGDAASETIAVSAGDEIAIAINSCGAGEYDVTPAGDVYFNAYFAEVVGTEINPYLPEWNWNDAWTDGTVTVTVPAGVETYYVGITSANMLLTVNDGEPEMVNGSYWMPQIIELAGNAEEDTVYELHLYYPEGGSENPYDIEAGTHTAEIAEGSQGAYYTFIAPDNGEVTVTINEGETGWQYFVNNMTSYIYGDYHWSDDEVVVTSETLTVSKGDELMIFVTTYDGSWTAPAGTVSFTVDFVGAEGTESNPVQLDALVDNYYEIPVGETLYYTAQGVGNMEMYVLCPEGTVLEMNGETYVADKHNVIVVQMPDAPANMPAFLQTPVVFSITNTYFETDFISGPIWFDYPVGSEQNPQQMTLGKKNTANVSAGDMDGYLFTWTATGNGVLEVAMNTGKNWTYCVNNLTAGIYGDTRWSDDVPVVKKEYIAVNTGDEIQIMVNTYDPADMWNSPAGKIEFTPKLIVSYADTLLAGKNVTLKVLDSTTGKALAANKYTWTLTYEDGTEVPAEIATLKAGKLTAAKTVAEATTVIATASNEAGEEHVFTVTIWPAATSVTIKNNGEAVDSKTTLTLITNKSETWPVLSAEVAPSSALNAVTWKSSNTKVADIDENGNVYPVGNKGNVTFTATAADGSGKKATVKINVTTEVTQIDVVSKNGMYFVGAGKALTMVANTNLDAVNQKVTWSIKMWDENWENLVDVPKEIATINSSGKLTAGKGLTDWYDIQVIATAQDGSGVMGEAWVTVQPIAASVEINGIPENNTFDMNTWWPEFYLGADVLDAEGNFITDYVNWKSSSDKIATISEDGTVFCVKPGTVTFTATANDGSNKKASVKVTIVKSPTEVMLPSRVVVAAGKTADLSKAEVLEADASNKKLIWTFDDPETAAALGVKVSNGKVSTNAKLITEPVELALTATAVLGDADGNYASDTTIIMIFPATKSVSIMSNGASVGKSVDLTSGDSIVLYAENEPVNAAGRYSWTSSNENVAAVEYNPDGSVTVKVHALKTSKATITATAVDGTNKKASVTLNVVADVDALGLDGAVVLSGKSVKMSSNLFFLDWNSEYEYYDIVTPVSKTVTWTLSLADYSDGTGNPTFIPCENNECYAGTLNANTGVFTAAKVTEAAYCFVTATYIDEDGNEIVSNGAQITVTPVALKGIDIIGCEGAWDEAAAAKITGKTVSTATGRYVLDVKPTNPEGDPVHYMWWIDLSDWENFTTEWEEILVEEYDEEGNLLYSYTNNVPVIVPVDDGDPYGTVKVTIIADGGVIKKASTTIKFMEPTAE